MKVIGAIRLYFRIYNLNISSKPGKNASDVNKFRDY